MVTALLLHATKLFGVLRPGFSCVLFGFYKCVFETTHHFSSS